MNTTSPLPITSVTAIEFISMTKMLAQTSKLSAFLSECWLDSWAKMCPDTHFYCVYFQTRLVGGFALNQTTIRKYGVSQCQLFLHRKGQQVFDQVWIEENDVICMPEHRDLVWQALFDVFEQSKAEQLLVGMSYQLTELENSDYELTNELSSPSYAKSLCAAHTSLDILFQDFSRNTRSQLKRAINKLAAEITINKAQNKQQAFDMLSWASTHHIKRWHDSGFLNKQFIEFHKRLISTGIDSNQVALLQVNVGEQVAAVYYYFLQDKRVYFYLGAVNYDGFDDKFKIGLVAHCYAMTHFARLGFEKYDFLAGEARYKASLSDEQTLQYMYVLSKPTLKLKLIKALKSLKQIITKH